MIDECKGKNGSRLKEQEKDLLCRKLDLRTGNSEGS